MITFDRNTQSSPRLIEALQRPELENAIHKLFPRPYELLTIWVLIATVIVAAISAMFAWLQLRSDHERSRRELAMNLIRIWTDSIQVDTAAVVRFVRLLNEDQCNKLVKRKQFFIDNTIENADLLTSCLEFRFPNTNLKVDASRNTIEIDQIQAGYIIFMTAKYLNNLEAIMVAWYENIAKPHIIEGQFLFLRRDQEAHLGILRKAIFDNNNVDGYPCLTRFIQNLEPKYSLRPGFADSWPSRRRRNT